MKLHRLHAVLCAVLMLGALAGFEAQAQKADAVRPEVGKPLQEAQALMRSGKHREAMNKINEADAVPAKTANETFLIQRMRGSVASASGDNDAAIKAFEAVLNTGRVSGRDQLQMIQAVAVGYYKNKEYSEGGAVDAALLQGRRQRSGDAHRAPAELLPRQRLRQREQDARSARARIAAPPKRSCRSSPTATCARRTPAATSRRSRSWWSTTRRRNTGPTSSRACRRSPAFPIASA